MANGSLSMGEPGNDDNMDLGFKMVSLKRHRHGSGNSSDSDTDSISNTGKKTKPTKELVMVNIVSSAINLRKENPLEISKFLDDNVGRVNKIFPGRDDSINVICEIAQANILTSCKLYKKNAIKVKKVEKNKFIKGIIHGVDISIDKSSLDQLTSDGYHIINTFILPSKREVQSVVITFKGETLPNKVFLGYRAYTVKQFIARPLRCFKCQRFGHVSSKCQHQPRCYKCGEEHNGRDCSKPQEEHKCCNCGSSHSASYNKCPEYTKTQEIIKIKTTEKISYAQAAKLTNGKSTNPSVTKEPETSTNTSVPIDINKLATVVVKISLLSSETKFIGLSVSDKVKYVTDYFNMVLGTEIEPRSVFKTVTQLS